MAYTGHPCLTVHNFSRNGVVYVHAYSSMFNVSVYAAYYTTRFFCHNDFCWAQRYSSPRLEENTLSEAVVSSLCIAKAAW